MFKTVKKKSIRKRNLEDYDEDDDEHNEVLYNLKECQKLRKKSSGINIEHLVNPDEKKEEKVVDLDPFKIKTGGFVDMKKLNKSKITMEDLEHIGTSFAAETNCRDEDADMLNYVEKELAKRKGILDVDTQKHKLKTSEDILFELPEHLVSKKQISEDMLSNQLLSGIPEVDLGISTKIRNIEATEEAKLLLLEERKSKIDEGLAKFIPTNYAVNFVQHNRFNIEENAPKEKKIEAPKIEPVRVGDINKMSCSSDSNQANNKKQSKEEKATDDFHYEKFKKMARRH